MTYEVGVFERGSDEVRAVGTFVHVLVERGSGKTAEKGIAGDARAGLERIFVKERADWERKKAKL